MRKLKRSVAKANMEAIGVVQLFKKISVPNSKKKHSTFSLNWREYVTAGIREKRHEKEQEKGEVL